MLDQKRFGHDSPQTTGARQPSHRRDSVNQQDDQVAHRGHLTDHSRDHETGYLSGFQDRLGIRHPQALTQTRVDPTEAQQSLRQLVDQIRLTPRDGVLAIDVKGNLAAMLTAAVPADWDTHIALVAGACNQRYLQLWTGAA
jgi:hypothetical protein